MTRINVVPVKELSDQHLIAEYHELPRVIKQNINTENAPDCYKLGEGHVRWARKHATYCMHRYIDLCWEMKHRGFKVGQPWEDLNVLYFNLPKDLLNNYNPTKADNALNRQRLLEKYKAHPALYTWTKRWKPWYYTWIGRLLCREI